MKKLFLSIFALVLITGCGSKSTAEKVTVCSIDSPYSEFASGSQTITSEGDKVTKIASRSVLALASAEEMEALMAIADTTLAGVNAINGVKAEIEKIDETKLYEIMSLDVKTGDIDKMEQNGLIVLTVEGGKKAAYISLEKSLEQIELQGFVCKVQE